MVAALKKLAGGDVAGRFAAWWDGRAYSPGESGSSNPASEDTKTEKISDEAPGKDRSRLSSGETRLAALETLWGAGRFSPSGSELFTRVSEVFNVDTGEGPPVFGALNSDPAWVRHIMGTIKGVPVIGDWRKPVIARFKHEFPDFDVIENDLDRPAFEVGSLDALLSIDAFAFSDHKSGLAVRALRALKPGGVWCVLDTVRCEAKGDLAPAYASAWGEPQITTTDEIEELVQAAGFEIRRPEDDVTGDVVQACLAGFQNLGSNLDTELAQQLAAVDPKVFAQELGWEAKSWKLRQRAYAGDLIGLRLWIFAKPE